MSHEQQNKDMRWAARPNKPRKYRNKPTVVDGIKFASKREAARYGELKLLARRGEIRDLECHPSYSLTINGMQIGTYTADFRYRERVGVTARVYGDIVVEDVKSPATAKAKDFRRTLKLMKAIHGIEVRVVL